MERVDPDGVEWHLQYVPLEDDRLRRELEDRCCDWCRLGLAAMALFNSPYLDRATAALHEDCYEARNAHLIYMAPTRTIAAG